MEKMTSERQQKREMSFEPPQELQKAIPSQVEKWERKSAPRVQRWVHEWEKDWLTWQQL